MRNDTYPRTGGRNRDPLNAAPLPETLDVLDDLAVLRMGQQRARERLTDLRGQLATLGRRPLHREQLQALSRALGVEPLPPTELFCPDRVQAIRSRLADAGSRDAA